MTGGAGADYLAGSARSDRLSGGPGADQLTDGTGDDVVDGGPGPDRVDGPSEATRVRCGTGRDYVAMPTGPVFVQRACEGVAPLDFTGRAIMALPRLVSGGIRADLSDQCDLLYRRECDVTLTLPGIATFHALVGAKRYTVSRFRRLSQSRVESLRGRLVTARVSVKGRSSDREASYRFRMR